MSLSTTFLIFSAIKPIMSEVTTNGTANLCPYKILKDLPKVLPPDFILPNLPSKCTWTKDTASTAASPHAKRTM